MRSPTATAEFAAIAAPRAVDEIESQIRDMVAQGRLKPGDRLPSERDLAAKLNVSRNTLREALRTLERAGILEMRKGVHGGAYILHGSSDAIIDGFSNLYHLGAISPQQLTEARIWLSEIVVRIACERATEEDLRALDENIRAGRRAIAEDRFDVRQKLHREFHLILARITRNPIIESTMAGVMEVMGLFIERIGPSENAFTEPARDRLMKHLRNRDADSAVKEMTSYLKRLQTRYLNQWAEREPPRR
ncbi:MAG: GntR family transcriptional regulator [Pigmentiphaga sp.]|uniref:FadR/GntR family transcriptional regulator n=1 Tax=Pigmentiphaga sp. TaxID=1977564 RepID=UPI0029B2146F|nr:GntR family transcriptional regulator [Pigmentiphaga sp.]MDX3906792.1 GntR family transcriptional regulator [Pigmentiphaga sp.]